LQQHSQLTHVAGIASHSNRTQRTSVALRAPGHDIDDGEAGGVVGLRRVSGWQLEHQQL